MASKNQYLPPIHPGEILQTEFLIPLGMSQNHLAREIGVPPRRINEIVLGKRAISADTAIRLGRFFGMSAQFWMGLQAEYELDCIRYEEQMHPTSRFAFIKRFTPVAAAL